jgi:hypothetical protein
MVRWLGPAERPWAECRRFLEDECCLTAADSRSVRHTFAGRLFLELNGMISPRPPAISEGPGPHDAQEARDRPGAIPGHLEPSPDRGLGEER